MDEKPIIDIRRFEPKKISSKYWVKLFLYGLILAALIFWYKYKSDNPKSMLKASQSRELDLKGVKIEE